jgi:hypothetical protein
MAGEASARGERVRELGIQARDCINTDFNVDNPDTPPRARQKLIAAATLLRAMPAPSTPEARNLHREAMSFWLTTPEARNLHREAMSFWPSTPEARNLHREAQALIEQAAVQQAESSASRNRQQGDARGDGGAQGAEPSVHAGGQRNTPPTRGARRPESGSSTLAGRRATAMPATSSMIGGRAKRRRGRPQATTPDGVGATTAMKTARRRRNPRGPACSAGRSARQPSRSTSASQ